MKTLTLFLSIGFASICFTSNAQVANQAHQQTEIKPAVVTKGYYAIGNHAAKLNASTAVKTETNTNTSIRRTDKGFYAIASNHKKLKKQMRANATREGTRPKTTKGYYSIGSNNK